MNVIKKSLLAITIILTLSITCCTDDYRKECKYYDLCDSLFYCSFTLDTSEYLFHQEFVFGYQQTPFFDTLTKKQQGTVLINQFSSLEYNFFITFSKEFLFNEYTAYVANWGNELNFSMIKNLTQEKAKEIYLDTLKPAEMKSILFDTTSSDYYSSYHYQTGGFYLEFADKEYNYGSDWKSYPVDSSQTFQNNKNHNYCVVDKITPYKDSFFIIEGRFKLNVYNIYQEYFDEKQINIKYIDNGEFKLVIQIPSDSFNYSY